MINWFDIFYQWMNKRDSLKVDCSMLLGSRKVSSLCVTSQHVCVVLVWSVPQLLKNSDVFAKNIYKGKYLHFVLLLIKIFVDIINKSTNNKCWQGCRKKGILVLCCWECRLVQPLWKTVWNFLKKLKMELPFRPVIPLQGLCPKNPETPFQKNLCTPMFITAVFTIAKC